MSEVLLPCPFCGTPASIRPVARSWWKIVVDHPEACILSGRFDDAIVPQRDEDKAGLVEDWNTRAALTSATAVPEAIRKEIDGLTTFAPHHDGNGMQRGGPYVRLDEVLSVLKGVQPGERGEG